MAKNTLVPYLLIQSKEFKEHTIFNTVIMSTFINEEEKLKHPYYKLMELKGQALETELNSWSRLDLIKWLCWNDRNGVYKDEDSIREFDNILSKEEAIEIITRQIIEA